jgi:hypothetical protein
MKAEFTALLRQLISECGKDALLDATRCKAFLATVQGQNITERRLLQHLVESGITNGIANAGDVGGDVALYKAQAVQKLQNDYYYAPNVADGAVNVLIDMMQTAPSANNAPQVQAPPSAVPQALPQAPKLTPAGLAGIAAIAGSVMAILSRAMYRPFRSVPPIYGSQEPNYYNQSNPYYRPQRTSYDIPVQKICQYDNLPLLWTGKTDIEWGKLVKEYECAAGHTYWLTD